MSRADTRFIPLLLDFIKHARIQSKEVQAIDDKGAELNLWGSQKLFLQNLGDGLDHGVRKFYVLKSRQLGMTTFTLLIAIFWMALHPNCLGCIVADTDDNSRVFRNTLKQYLAGFPKGFLGKFGIVKGKDNKAFMQFTNGSRLDFLVAGSRKENWGESRGYIFALLSEVAKYGNPKGLANFAEALSETHPDRLVIYESTANKFNHWRDMWLEAARDTHTKRKIFVGWWSKELNSIKRTDPRWESYGTAEPNERERELMRIVATHYGVVVSREQLAWKRWKDSDESATEQDADQNQPWTEEEAFVLDGYSFFQSRVIQDDMDRIYGVDTGEPIRFEGYKYHIGKDFGAIKMEQITEESRLDEVDLRVWQQPMKGGVYAIGGDPAFGRNDWKDRSAISVLRCYADKLVQVAEYATPQHDTFQMACVLAHIAGAYRDCWVNLELSGPGRVVAVELDHIKEKIRAELYAKQTEDMGWDDALQQAKWYLYHRWDSTYGGYAKGFETTGRTKFEIMNQIRDVYSTRVLETKSIGLLTEMINVTQEGYDISAKGRGKDDRVFACALAVRAWIDWARGPLIANGMTYQRVTEMDEGSRSSEHILIDNVIDRWFMRKEEEAQAAPYAPKWMIDRGLA